MPAAFVVGISIVGLWYRPSSHGPSPSPTCSSNQSQGAREYAMRDMRVCDDVCLHGAWCAHVWRLDPSPGSFCLLVCICLVWLSCYSTNVLQMLALSPAARPPSGSGKSPRLLWRCAMCDVLASPVWCDIRRDWELN